MRKVSARCVLNYKALDAIRKGLVDGLSDMGRATIADTHAPDDDPTGQGLVTTGDWGVWADGRKVAGTASKPRTVKTPKGAIVLVVGYGFPGRFNELGTVHQPARPFLTPAMLETIPGTEDYVRGPVRAWLRLA